MLFNEYALKLSSTGEVFIIAEISNESISHLNRSGIEVILDRCMKVPKDIIEEAKLGNTDKFQKFLKTPPIGIMIKLNLTCRLFDDCTMSDKIKCNTKKSELPVCWEFGKPSKVGSELSSEEDFASQCVHFWNNKAIVVITY